ncbi:MAG: sigma-70 family RNA polymerase sigma factor [Candidatus Poribacteria bacterium]|nr:sigma-70 family RNA polymerase sigma factor [Candidatus Poribacteria bacterium]
MESQDLNYFSDIALLERIQNGDDIALVQLINKYEALLWKIIHGEIPDVDAREDVFADTRLAIIQRFHRNSKGIHAVDKWIKQVARSKCKEYWRQAKKRQEVATLAEELYDGTQNCPQHWEQLWSEVLEVVHKLGPIYVEMVEWWMQGWTAAEIGKHLGIPEGTVKSRQNTIRREVRAYFDE